MKLMQITPEEISKMVHLCVDVKIELNPNSDVNKNVDEFVFDDFVYTYVIDLENAYWSFKFTNGDFITDTNGHVVFKEVVRKPVMKFVEKSEFEPKRVCESNLSFRFYMHDGWKKSTLSQFGKPIMKFPDDEYPYFNFENDNFNAERLVEHGIYLHAFTGDFIFDRNIILQYLKSTLKGDGLGSDFNLKEGEVIHKAVVQISDVDGLGYPKDFIFEFLKC